MKNAPQYGHEEWFRVRTHEIDHNKRLTIPNLLMLMQEASMQNVLKLNLSVWDLESKAISWVILRKHLTVYKAPLLNQEIKIVTYPAGFDRVFAYRDFWMTDKNGEVLAHASSTWTLMNTHTRKMQRIPKAMLSISSPVGNEKLPAPPAKILIPDRTDNEYSYVVRQFDLDWNNHVNNVALSKLILQGVPMDQGKQLALKTFTFHIKSECFYQEALRITFHKSDEVHFAHQITGTDDRLIAVAESQWA